MNVLSSSTGMGMMGTIIWIVVLLVFVFVFMLRPQKKEQARRNEMMSKMAVGDTVLTSSGFYGTLIDINADTVIVEWAWISVDITALLLYIVSDVVKHKFCDITSKKLFLRGDRE